ncbi:MAG: ComEA family DNA-binding protein [Lachnospiraceae bacterium]|nr:ComEA family DNA-binding protein [Lachnospiraceae bacterium]
MKKLITLIIMILILALPGCASSRRSDHFQAEASTGSSAASRAPSETPAESGKVFVYVCGEVIRPGVYELVSGSRVKDAIDLAGGLSSDADMAGINQASRVKDQDKIVVPARNSGVSGASGTGSGLLDINRATKEQLMALPGIGESKALAIISYREKTGGFKSIEEIQKIEGIKSGVFNKIKDSISVG